MLSSAYLHQTQMNKRLSIYTQGGKQAAVMYYRFFQYFSSLECVVRYNQQLSDSYYARFSPISKQSLLIKGWLWLYISLRVTGQLLRDVVNTPDVVVVSRTFVNKHFIFSYKLLLNWIKNKGCVVIWDFDDDICAMKEIGRSNFNYLARISDYIVLASPYLVESLPNLVRDKVKICPTTDGELHRMYNQERERERLESFENKIRFLWVGTASGIKFLENILPQMERIAEQLTACKKRVLLVVVSNQDLVYEAKNFEVQNIKWTRDIACQQFLSAHIGLMPLDDSLVCRGKGGFKLIQYFSVGLPSLASTVGINKNILEQGGGIAIDSSNPEKWIRETITLCTDIECWKQVSRDAIKNYVNNYNYERNLTEWQSLIN